MAIAGLIMWYYPQYEIIDPICTLVFSIVALTSTLPLVHRVSMILFEGAPSHIDWEIVLKELSEISGVENVHDLHIWSISSKSISLTCHMRVSHIFFHNLACSCCYLYKLIVWYFCFRRIILKKYYSMRIKFAVI